jgi:hypothetical protein
LRKAPEKKAITSSFVMTLNTAADDYKPNDNENGNLMSYANVSSMHYNITLDLG